MSGTLAERRGITRALRRSDIVEAHASAIGRGGCLADAFLDEDTTMKTPTPRIVLSIALFAAFAGNASAQATRAEVRAAYA